MTSNLDELSQPTDRIAMDRAPLPFFERLKSGVGQSRRFRDRPATSDLPRLTDIVGPTRLVWLVPIGDTTC
jgi:hypothetical protein